MLLFLISKVRDLVLQARGSLLESDTIQTMCSVKRQTQLVCLESHKRLFPESDCRKV